MLYEDLVRDEISKVTEKLLDIFPDVTFHISEKRGNLRIHFKADKDNFVPSKWMLCNVMGLSERQVSVNIKQFQFGVWDSPGKLFVLRGYF